MLHQQSETNQVANQRHACNCHHRQTNWLWFSQQAGDNREDKAQPKSELNQPFHKGSPGTPALTASNHEEAYGIDQAVAEIVGGIRHQRLGVRPDASAEFRGEHQNIDPQDNVQRFTAPRRGQLVNRVDIAAT